MEKEDFDAYVRAGEIARRVKDFARGYVRAGMKLIDLAEAIDDKILELGGELGFPVGLGVDEVAAHFTPTADSDEVARGLLKVDIGVSVDGFIADTAFSVDLTEDNEYGDLIEFNEKVLEVASGCVRVGMRVSDIGDMVGDFVDEEGDDRFVVVKGLCGHSLGQNVIHCAPTVPNHRNECGYVFADDAFAIEPFVSLGSGEIVEGKGGGIYSLQGDSVVRDRDAREVVRFVAERFCGRPFCRRWIERGIREGELDVSLSKLRFCLGLLVRSGVFYEYPILLDRSRSVVSQAENTFVVANGEVVCTTA
jgi:methionyl aminopeptidase